MLVLPAAANAQTWSVSGTVVDGHGVPVVDVRVEVEGTFQRVMSGVNGSFVLRDVRGDSASLIARRLGYLPRTLTVRRGQSAGVDIRIVVEAVPLLLSGVVVPSDASAPGSQVITRESVRNLPALGESDIMRVLPFVGGVSQPNDMMSVVHLGGSSADEVSYALDGHPVQAPLHFHGMFSGINLAAIDRVDVFSAHEPTAVDSRLGGLLDIRSRDPKQRRREVVASVLSSGVTVTEPAIVKDASVLASARVTYLEFARRVLPIESIAGDVPLPSYADALLRVDLPLSARWHVDPLLLLTEDKHASGREGYPTVVSEILGGIRALRSGQTWTSEVRLSTDVFAVGNSEQLRGQKRIDISQRLSTGSVSSIGEMNGYRVTAKLSVDQRTHRLAWLDAFSTQLAPGLPDSADQVNSQRIFFGAAEASRYLSKALIVSAGNRTYGVGGNAYWAPTLRAEWSRGDRLTVTGSVDRRYQFDAEYTPRVEETIAQPVFLFDRPRWSDGGAITAKTVRGGAARLVSAEVSGFGRAVHERPIGLDTRDTRSDTAVFAFRSGRTVGATTTLSIAATDGTSLQAAYTFQRALTRDSGTTRPADWDIPHTLALFVGQPIGRRWSLTAAFQWHSGLPVTPIAARVFVPSVGFPVGLNPRLLFGDPNSARLPSYQRLDLGILRRWSSGRADWELSGQIINALGKTNVFEYDWHNYVETLSIGKEPSPDRSGLPILPSIGLTVKW